MRATSCLPLERTPSKRLLAASLGYLLALLVALALLRWVGERWWVTTVGLYLPTLIFALPLPVLVWRLWRRRARALWLTVPAALLLLIFPLGGFVLPGRPRRDGRAPALRVLSYNVMHGYGGPERVMAEIDRFAPDVVLLQKLSDNQEPMRRLLAGRYPHVELTGDGEAVASRFPFLSGRPPDPLPRAGSPASAYFVKALATPLGPIAFYSCHFTSPRQGLLALAGLRTGGLQLLKNETSDRVDQLRDVAARARAETIPVVIAGDTNLPALSPVLREELSRYQDGFREAGWGFGYTYPFNLFRWMRIDRIVASDSLRFVGFQRGASTASDHVCVVADLQRR